MVADISVLTLVYGSWYDVSAYLVLYMVADISVLTLVYGSWYDVSAYLVLYMVADISVLTLVYGSWWGILSAQCLSGSNSGLYSAGSLIMYPTLVTNMH
jgi:hypothetical protein